MSATSRLGRNPDPRPAAGPRESRRHDSSEATDQPPLTVDEVLEVFADNGVAEAVDLTTGSMSRETNRALQAGAELGVTLDAGQCAQLFAFLLVWSDADLES